ncbi:hypothetical protein GCM10010274_24260 [Streptomyces lavendofoliae]|uniref:Uncharacterized protein n=1 Tax=Streptomyces lavendofoliae TaxID=67314 RepID=A0A918HX88_9ACTN|nr:hypothetical protein GCM10010274_24260 [Streptomyces lavendofoliae]
MRTAVLADSDARWNRGAPTARPITPPGHRVTGSVPRGRATPAARRLAGGPPPRRGAHVVPAGPGRGSRRFPAGCEGVAADASAL